MDNDGDGDRVDPYINVGLSQMYPSYSVLTSIGAHTYHAS